MEELLGADFYTSRGYEDREHYLNSIAEEYGVSECFVHNMAQILGPSEDFTGLVAVLDNHAQNLPEE